MDTLELLPSLAQGVLGETSAAELVAAVFRSRASGTLSIDSQDTGEIRAFFRAGDMCGTASFAGFRTLAHVLLEHDFVGALETESTRDESAQAQKRHGEVLVAKGLLTPEQLRQALAIQCRENLGVLLALSSGTYEWRGWEPPPPWTREMSIEPVSAMFEALASPHIEARRRHIVGWLGSHAARLSSDWNELRARIALGPDEMRAAASLATPRTAEEFVRGSGLPRERAEALLVALLLGGGAEPTDAAAAAEPEQDMPELDTAVVEPLPAPEADDLQTPFEKTLTPPSVAKASQGPAVEDEPLELAESDDRGRVEAPEPDERTREVRRRLLQRGLRNLGAPLPIASQAPARADETEELELQTESEAELPPELRAFADEVRERAAKIDAQDAYVRLGVPRNAGSDSVKQAYLAAAKRFHPDRAAVHPGMQPVLRDLQHVFAALREAHEMIGTPEARAEYDRSLRSGTSGGASRKDQATMALKMGEVLLKKRDYDGAVANLRRAVAFEATGDALAALAWALVADPKQSPAGKEEAVSLVNRAVRAAGVTARTWYVAGVLWRTTDPAGAADAFRKALELDPRHADASLELRLLETRQSKAASKGKRKP